MFKNTNLLRLSPHNLCHWANILCHCPANSDGQEKRRENRSVEIMTAFIEVILRLAADQIVLS